MIARFGKWHSALAGTLTATALAVSAAACSAQEYKSGRIWPEPKVVEPGKEGNPPADAVVLFDGKDMSAFTGADAWEVKDGAVTIHRAGRSGGQDFCETKQAFGDCQLHLEFATPEKVSGNGQGRGNSGVFFMQHYELQILDSYNNPTYFDGQCGAIYKQMPPQVNVSRKPGEWQTYDAVFHAPHFDDNGKVTKPASITAFQNGVMILDNFELEGGTFYYQPAEYTAHPPRLPLRLQDHGNPVKFRNIWIRELHPMSFTMPEKKPSEGAKAAKGG
ncbi:MAG TPA: DUF1080 domain-containing protein [Pirellulales bacterium]|jgi:hypothetical protein